MTKKYQKYLSFVLPTEIEEKLKRYAEKEDVSVGKVVRDALKEYLKDKN